MLRNVDVARYYPVIMREFREFQYLAQAENPELTALWQVLQNISGDQFILDATINGVARHERMLKIIPPASDTMDERKFRLLARYNEDLPYTVPNLRNQLEHLCGEDGYSLIILNNDFTVIVKVALVSKNNFKSVQELLERVIPQNMIIECILMYNQHQTLANYTHDQLAAWAYDHIRNEVLD